MSTKRINRTVHKEKNFTSVENSTLRDCNLSYRALGILCESLSHKEEWEVTRDWLVDRRREGREAISGAMRELEQAGYITFLCAQHDNGKFISVGWCFFEVPVEDCQKTNKTRWKTEDPSEPIGRVPVQSVSPSDGNAVRSVSPPVQDKRPSPQKTINKIDRSFEETEESENQHLKTSTSPSPNKRATPFPVLPDDLKAISPEWERFLQHCKERGRPVTPTSASEILDLLWEMTDEEAIRKLKTAITGGYTGIMPPIPREAPSNKAPAGASL